MKTEYGSVKSEFQMNEKVQLQLMRKPYIISIILLAVGVLGILACVAVMLYFKFTDRSYEWYDGFIIFFVPCALGVSIQVAVRDLCRQAARSKSRKIIYEFFSDCVLCREYLLGRPLGIKRIDYSSVARIKETKDYLFFFNAKNEGHTVAKDTFTAEEFDVVKLLLRNKAVDGCGIPTVAEALTHIENMNAAKPDEDVKEEYDENVIDGIFELSGAGTKENAEDGAHEENARSNDDGADGIFGKMS